MITQVCSKCYKKKRITDFHKDKTSKSKYCYHCKLCVQKNTAKHYRKNKERIKKKVKQYAIKNKIRIAQKTKAYAIKNKEHIKIYQKNWRESHKKYSVKYQKNYRITHQKSLAEFERKRRLDINFRLKSNLRSRLWKVLKRKKSHDKILNLIDCSLEYLKQYLENQFKKGMTWKNYGKWHVDHKRPCNSFNLSKTTEQQKCFHYTNLQPLWAKDNLIKGTKYYV